MTENSIRGHFRINSKRRWIFLCVLPTTILSLVFQLTSFQSKAQAYVDFNNWRPAGVVEDPGCKETNNVTTTTNFIRDEQSNSSKTLDVRPMFDPFQDITFDLLSSDRSLPYSSFHCVATGTRNPSLQTDRDSLQEGQRPRFTARSCSYRNIYYRPSDQTFHYFASPTEQTARSAGNDDDDIFTSNMQVSIGHVDDQMDPRKFERFKITPWAPQVHPPNALPPPHHVFQAGPQKLKFLLYRPFHSMNLGDSHTQAVPFFVELPNERNNINYGGSDPSWRCSPANHLKWVNCVKVYRKLYHEFTGVKADNCTGDILRTGNWLLGPERVGLWRNSDRKGCQHHPTNTLPPALLPTDSNSSRAYVVLPEVLAGTGRLANFFCGDDCSIGRAPSWFQFRNFLLRKIRHVPAATAPIGYITFSIPVGTSRPDEVWWFEDEIKAAKMRYGEDVVRVVNMANITIQDQARIVTNSAVLITNHGGGGFVSLFLPKGAGALVFWHKGIRFDHAFYESAGYFRPVWIGVEERPQINRTMAIIDYLVEQSSLVWPNIVAATATAKPR